MWHSDRYVFAVESSCDDTSFAWVGEQGDFYELRASQTKLHIPYGGVVPELASREHFDQLEPLYQEFYQRYPLDPQKIHFVTATLCPGLMGPLLVGAYFARGLAQGWSKEFLGCHHLRGHLASVLLSEETDRSLSLKEKTSKVFPATVLLVSGGHTLLAHVEKDLSAETLVETVDDAAGECFDKCAKLMGLAYPGGPELESLARKCQSSEDCALKKELLDLLPFSALEGRYSFSGLKSAFRRLYEKESASYPKHVFCAALEERIAQILVAALKKNKCLLKDNKALVLCGGVAANATVRRAFQNYAQENSLNLYLPPLRYCTDNAAMIGAAAWVQNPKWIPSEVKARSPLSC